MAEFLRVVVYDSNSKVSVSGKGWSLPVFLQLFPWASWGVKIYIVIVCAVLLTLV